MYDLLEVENLYKHYDGFSLRQIGFRLPRGSIMGLIGGNGAGKTTTIKLILNQTHRDMGEIRLFGLDVKEYEEEVKKELGVVLDEGFFNPSFRPRQIAAILRPIYEKWDDALFTQYLRRFELPENKPMKEYSRGMKMKLSIATALAHKPRLLIMDEPTSGLDPIVRAEILDVFRDFIQEEDNGILLSSHITSDLEKVADYITFLHKGKLLLSEEKDVLMERCAVARFPASRLEQLDSRLLTGLSQGSFGCEALVTDRRSFARAYPEIQLENAALEEIMRFMAEGVAQG